MEITGTVVKRVRREMGLNQSDFGALFGMKQSQISYLELQELKPINEATGELIINAIAKWESLQNKEVLLPILEEEEERKEALALAEKQEEQEEQEEVVKEEQEEVKELIPSFDLPKPNGQEEKRYDVTEVCHFILDNYEEFEQHPLFRILIDGQAYKLVYKLLKDNK